MVQKIPQNPSECNGTCKIKKAIPHFEDNSDRTLTQEACLLIFQSDRSLSAQEAAHEWISKKYADKFCEIYTENACPCELYKRITKNTV
jgi:hypothetical protein